MTGTTTSRARAQSHRVDPFDDRQTLVLQNGMAVSESFGGWAVTGNIVLEPGVTWGD